MSRHAATLHPASGIDPSGWLHGYWALGVDVASIGGLVFALWSLVRIGRVANALRQERQALSHLLRLEELTGLMRTAADKLGRTHTPDSSLANQISESVGVVAGVIGALSIAEQERQATSVPGAVGATLIQDYFGLDMLRRVIGAADSLVDILVFRPHGVTNVEVMALLHDAVRREVAVRVLSLSSDAPTPLLEELCWTLPNPRVHDVSVLKEQLDAAATFYEDNVVGTWSDEELSRFDHRVYTHYPTLHYVRSDFTLYVGFSATEAGTQPADKSERTALAIGVDTRLGEQLVGHYTALVGSSDSLFSQRDSLSSVDSLPDDS